jgi:hypothetical protein
MTDIGRLVVLDEHEATLVIHVLVVFERLLRQGNLRPDQLRLLVPDGVTVPADRADLEMAEVVVEASAPLGRQLD